MAGDVGGWNPGRPGHDLLDILKDEIRTKGQPSADRVREIANLTGTTAAKVRGVIGYYSELKLDDSTVRVCMGESCRARGSEAIAESLAKDGETVGTLHCAGLCTSGPAILREERMVPMGCNGTGLQLFVSMDSISQELGAEEVVQSLIQELDDTVSITRTGSRGLFHLEPMIEVDIDGTRHAFGPIQSGAVASLVQSISNGSANEHPAALGPIDSLTELNSQTRFAMARMGAGNPLDLEVQRELGAYTGLANARNGGAEFVLQELELAGLRGRGGAGFPTHFKWRSAMEQDDPIKHVVANADEGDAGTFIDRMVMEGDPHALIEGMLICAETIGATQGWVYLRSEYPQAKRILQSAIDSAREEGILGEHFDITIALGAGSYVCGEETALLESLEGRRGEVRSRPPYPTEKGLFGHPTIVNNVLTFSMAAAIMREGGSVVGGIGTEQSKGTLVAQISGDVGVPTCVEVPFGGTVAELFDNYSSLDEVVAVQVGGPLGGVFAAEELENIELSFEGLSSADGLLGHGGFVCYGTNFKPRSEVLGWMRFFRDESCGKCTPCRIGTQRALELLQRIGTDLEKEGDRTLLADLDEVMTETSLCALGGLAMNPVRSTMKRWPASFGGESNE
ncbi:MAG: NADH-ubiquinone oxidoreductase-F iron-sulfur binding region domain-containing protein [Candidatus Thalassarchaeaceae archaeon]|jgi:formate dehydrogenase iron-sulfur subunit|nr:NADH-ubiquinone oxidoreductase-F iron-sulfur binding region domain-containing protein [Candidatus Thalassarchaeaceae archaeon]